MADGRTKPKSTSTPTPTPAKPGPFAGGGVDYSQYASWPQVVAPSGQIYYRVPGTGYLLDPFLSAAKGRPVLFNDPSAKASEAQKQKDLQAKAQKQAMFNQSPAGQIVPVVGGIAGVIGANEIFKAGIGTPPPTVHGVLQNGNIIFSDGSIKDAAGNIVKAAIQDQATKQIAQQVPSALPQAAAGNAVPGVIPPVVPPIAPPSIPGLSTGLPTTEAGNAAFNAGADTATQTIGEQAASTAPTTIGGVPVTIGNVVGAAAAAKGAYDGVKGFDRGGEGGRSGLTTVGAGLGSFGGPIGSVVGAGIGNLAGYGLQDDGIKNDLALAATGVGIPLVIARRLGLLPGFHQTTRQVAQEHTGELLDIAPEDKAYQDLVKRVRAPYESAPSDPSKPFFGQYATFEDYKKGGLNAADLSGTYGVLKVGGPAYAHLSPQEQTAYTQRLIDNNLLDSKKGEVIVTDETKAKELFDQGGFNIVPTVATVAAKPPPIVIKPTSNQTPVVIAAPANMPKVAPSFTRAAAGGR